MTIIVVQKKSRRGLGAYTVPAGGEILWFGAAGELPADYQIVSAASGKFVMGAAQGQATDTPAGANSHKHTYSENTNTTGAHTHTADGGGMGGSSGTITHYPTSNEYVVGAHSHNPEYGFVSSSAGSHYHVLQDTELADVLPPYRRLYWIKALVDVECPIRGIVVWNKTLGEIPDGFAVCNGNNGTPDMREKFVYVADVDGDVGNAGGAETHSHVNKNTLAGGGHTHSITVQNGHVFGEEKASGYGGTANMAEPHRHTGSGNFDNDLDHSHTLGNTNAANHLPQYLYLYYMMRTA